MLEAETVLLVTSATFVHNFDFVADREKLFTLALFRPHGAVKPFTLAGMNIDQQVQTYGGVTRTSLLIAAGRTPYEIKLAIRRGVLQRPRRGWVAAADADPQLVFAAANGVVLTCITAAKRLGLWVLGHDRPHVATLRGRHVDVDSMRVHRHRPFVPRPPAATMDGLENVLEAVAKCQPHDTALAIWDSALQKQLIDIRKLETLPLSRTTKQLITQCTPFSDSGLETFFRTRLAWLGVPIQCQAWLYGRRVDFLIGDRLVVQLDGRDHVGAQRTRDNEHDALLRLHGYHVIRIGYAQIVHGWHKVEADILGAIARNLHLAK